MFCPPIYIHFIKTVCSRHSTDETRLAVRKEKANGVMPVEAESNDKADREMAAHTRGSLASP